MLFSLIYGSFPFKGMSIRDIKIEILTTEMFLKENVSGSVRDLLKKMLQKEPKVLQ